MQNRLKLQSLAITKQCSNFVVHGWLYHEVQYKEHQQIRHDNLSIGVDFWGVDHALKPRGQWPQRTEFSAPILLPLSLIHAYTVGPCSTITGMGRHILDRSVLFEKNERY